MNTYTIKNLSSGHLFEVAGQETILDGALRQGRILPYGCRNGACGSCKCLLVKGSVEHDEFLESALSDEEAAKGEILACRAHPKGDLVIDVDEVESAEEIEVRTLPCKISKIERVAEDVVRLFLRLPENEALEYLPGQFLELFLPEGKTRAYSLASRPERTQNLELHIRLVPGGLFSDQLLTSIKEGALLRFRGPLGSFFLRQLSLRPILLIAGGTGFAPIKAIIEETIALGNSRPIHLYWGVRSKANLYLNSVIKEWESTQPHLSFTPVLSEPGSEGEWNGATGFVHEAVLQDHADLSAFDVYVAGPPQLIESVKKSFPAQGLDDQRLFFDAFSYAPG